MRVVPPNPSNPTLVNKLSSFTSLALSSALPGVVAMLMSTPSSAASLSRSSSRDSSASNCSEIAEFNYRVLTETHGSW